MANDKNNRGPQGPFIKPLSAREFLEFFPLGMSDAEKDELAAEIDQTYADRKTVTKDEIRFRKILASAGREGTEELLRYLKNNGFFTAPGSVSHHSNWKGGLVSHSLKVYDSAMEIREEMIKDDPTLLDILKEEKVAVAALLHDVCKADEYKIRLDGTPARKEALVNLGGHGDKSVMLILFHGFKLQVDEMLAIRWHMGAKYIKDPKDKAECEKAKAESALVRLIIRADHKAATGK